MPVFVANESAAPADETLLAGLSRFLLDALGVHPAVELSVLLVDEDQMASLHEQFMGEAGPTDVMAFPMDELTEHGSYAAHDDGPGPALLGDVVLCPTVAAAQAAERGHSTEHELHVLTTHGVLHLLGYDHAEPDEEQAMFARQAELLAAWQAAQAT